MSYLKGKMTSNKYTEFKEIKKGVYEIWNKIYNTKVGYIKKARMGTWMHWQLILTKDLFKDCDEIGFSNGCLKEIVPFITSLYSKKEIKEEKEIPVEKKIKKDQQKLTGEVDFKERDKFIDLLQAKKMTYQTIMNYLFYYDKFRSAQNMNQQRVNSFLKKYKYNSIVKAFINNYRTFILTNENDYDKEVISNVRSILIPRETGGKSSKLPDYITEKEVWKMEEYFERERDKIMLLLSFYCGLRLGGLIKIRPHSFNWEEWDSAGKDIGKLKVVEKGNKERIVIVPSKLMPRIEKWIKEVAVKENPDSKKPLFKIGGRRWNYLLKFCSQKALNKPIHPHTLRHSFATHLLNKGVKIERVQILLGHTDISTTQKYLHIVQKDIEEDYSKLVDY